MAMADCSYSRNYVFWQDGVYMSRLENCSACRRGNNSHSSKAHLHDSFPDRWMRQKRVQRCRMFAVQFQDMIGKTTM